MGITARDQMKGGGGTVITTAADSNTDFDIVKWFNIESILHVEKKNVFTIIKF